MKDENSIRQELIGKLEKQIENVKNDYVFSYMLTNSAIATLAHVLELDLGKQNRLISEGTMLDICYEEFENLKEWIEEGKEVLGYDFLDTWDFEDEYSHNHIAENRRKFIELANEYFKENNLPYEARETCERAKIFEKNGR